jgi:hypothetical protein
MTHLPAAVRALEATGAALSQFGDTGAALSQFGDIGAALSQFGDTGAALSQFGDTAAALSLCAAGATAIAATVSVRRQWARRRLAQLRRGPTTAAAAVTTPTATGFARTGTIRTERRDAVGLWCSKPMVKSSA